MIIVRCLTIMALVVTNGVFAQPQSWLETLFNPDNHGWVAYLVGSPKQQDTSSLVQALYHTIGQKTQVDGSSNGVSYSYAGHHQDCVVIDEHARHRIYPDSFTAEQKRVCAQLKKHLADWRERNRALENNNNIKEESSITIDYKNKKTKISACSNRFFWSWILPRHKTFNAKSVDNVLDGQELNDQVNDVANNSSAAWYSKMSKYGIGVGALGAFAYSYKSWM